MVTKTKPAIVAIAVAAALMTTATLLPLTMTVTPAFAQDDGQGQKKVNVCHVPPGNPDNAHVITVGGPAADKHEENHGDNIGKKCKHQDDDDENK